MNDRRGTLSDLLLLSGIDLLLAALCVSVGILVLFLSSDASRSSKDALSTKPYERWWTLVATSSNPARYDLACASGLSRSADFHDEKQAIYFGNEWAKSACKLTVLGRAPIKVDLYTNDDCWSLLGAEQGKYQCSDVSPDNPPPVEVRVLMVPVPMTPAATLPPTPRSVR